MDTNWMARGNCRDEVPSRFFPSDGVEYALEQRIDHGVWGGASERERRRILKRRRLEAAEATGTR
jgi:WhiB family redox-sensing transcriptional regulator